jgi:hypothetical protein
VGKDDDDGIVRLALTDKWVMAAPIAHTDCMLVQMRPTAPTS